LRGAGGGGRTPRRTPLRDPRGGKRTPPPARESPPKGPPRAPRRPVRTPPPPPPLRGGGCPETGGHSKEKEKRHWTMIDIKPCRGCGRPLIHHRVANLDVRLEPTPLGAQEAVGEIIAQRSLWVVDQGKVRPARPGEAGPLREHRCRPDARQNGCTAAGAPLPPSPAPSGQPTPQRPPAGRTTRFSGPSAA